MRPTFDRSGTHAKSSQCRAPSSDGCSSVQKRINAAWSPSSSVARALKSSATDAVQAPLPTWMIVSSWMPACEQNGWGWGSFVQQKYQTAGKTFIHRTLESSCTARNAAFSSSATTKLARAMLWCEEIESRAGFRSRLGPTSQVAARCQSTQTLQRMNVGNRDPAGRKSQNENNRCRVIVRIRPMNDADVQQAVFNGEV